MKKHLLWLGFVVLSLFLGLFFYLYQNNRIILKYEPKKKDTSLIDNKYFLKCNRIEGVYYNEEQTIQKIPLTLSEEDYNNSDNQEKIIHTYLHKYFYYLNLEKNNPTTCTLYHIALDRNTLIINFHLEKKRKLSVIEEHYIVKSLFLTVKNILPSIENVYFFDREDPLKLDYLIPFFSNLFLDKSYDKKIEDNEYKIDFIYIIPFIKDNGKRCEDTYEKNIFQSFSLSEYIYFPQKSYPTYFEEINQLSINRPKKIILYININININKDKKVKYLFFPSYSPIKITTSKSQWPIISDTKNSIESFYINKLLKISNSTSEISPLLPIRKTIYPSIYVNIDAANINEAKKVLEEIVHILLP